MKAPVCKDCIEAGITTYRPAGFPGPRCATHWRTEVARRKLARHARVTEATYGLTDAQYWGLYKFQGGLCAGCKRAKGHRKRLSVDHDHFKGCGHPPDQACLKCVRALLCDYCNQVAGRLGLAGTQRMLDVLGDDPPAQRFLRASNTP